ncbi:MAG: hypothetical protein Q7T80_01385, partial [Methanoregula sp.]|nr:hypothetical protein [Methanoregula sp.]
MSCNWKIHLTETENSAGLLGIPITMEKMSTMRTEIIILLVLIMGITIPVNAISQWNQTDGAYTIVIFNGTGSTNWTTPAGVNSVEYLVVGGGGGGSGYFYGGGGGAGGFQTASGFNVSGDISVVVGKGGDGGSGSGLGAVGENSSFGTITSLGGGSGSNYYAPGINGGSGGGGSANDGPSAGTAGQGNGG